MAGSKARKSKTKKSHLGFILTMMLALMLAQMHVCSGIMPAFADESKDNAPSDASSGASSDTSIDASSGASSDSSDAVSNDESDNASSDPSNNPISGNLTTHDNSQTWGYAGPGSASKVDSAVDSSMSLSVQNAPSADQKLQTEAAKIGEFIGINRLETASLISKTAFPGGAAGVIVAKSSDFPDALSSTALAGTLDYPILLTDTASLSVYTADEIKRLGAKTVYLIGNEASIDNQVFNELEALVGVGNVTRLAGSNRLETAAVIRDKIIATNTQSKTLIITNGSKFPDSLSIAPYAVKSHSPILLTDVNGNLSAEFKQFINQNLSANGAKNKGFSRVLLIGSAASVSTTTEDFCKKLTTTANVIRLGGNDRFHTSNIVAQWCIDREGMVLQGLGLASGNNFPDGLAASVLLGKNNSVLHLIADQPVAIGRLGNLLTAGDNKNGSSVQVNIFGGTNAVSQSLRNQVINRAFDAVITTYNITLNAAVANQMTKSPQVLSGGRWVNATADQVKDYLDPNTVGADDFYQFAILSSYTGLTAADLNAYIASVAPANAEMRNKGAAFVNAAKTQGINEVYLVMHAAVETGWGSPSTVLSHGSVYKKEWGGDGKTYYNYFGIGAYDTDAVRYGTKFAAEHGWDTADKAIVGGAKFVKDSYIGDPETNTLYKMRWNPVHMAKGDWGKQYATAINWPETIALQMNRCYQFASTTPNIKYDIPAYK